MNRKVVESHLDITSLDQVSEVQQRLQHPVTDVGALAYEVCEAQRTTTRPMLTADQLTWCEQLAECMQVRSRLSPMNRAFVRVARGASLSKRGRTSARAQASSLSSTD